MLNNIWSGSNTLIGGTSLHLHTSACWLCSHKSECLSSPQKIVNQDSTVNHEYLFCVKNISSGVHLGGGGAGLAPIRDI